MLIITVVWFLRKWWKFSFVLIVLAPNWKLQKKFAVGLIDYYINFSLFWVWSRNNAGKFAHQHAISEDGIEMTFATNYLGKYCLNNFFFKKKKIEFCSYILICLTVVKPNIIFDEFSGHFLLTKLLLKKMIETAKATGIQGRIVNVSSSIHGWFSGDMIRYLGQISRNKR